MQGWPREGEQSKEGNSESIQLTSYAGKAEKVRRARRGIQRAHHPHSMQAQPSKGEHSDATQHKSLTI
jgi:hypothetical protein